MSSENTPPGCGSSSARSPIHVTMSAGSVKYGKTTSGGALMCSVATMTSLRISAVTAPSSVVGDGPARRPSSGGGGPELGEQFAHRLERLVAQRVEAAGALAALGEKAGLLEHADVLADRLLGEGEARRDLARGQLGALDEAQDLSAVRVGERPQYRIGCRGRRLLPLGHRRTGLRNRTGCRCRSWRRSRCSP